jgi:hypothetical protein
MTNSSRMHALASSCSLGLDLPLRAALRPFARATESGPALRPIRSATFSPSRKTAWRSSASSITGSSRCGPRTPIPPTGCPANGSASGAPIASTSLRRTSTICWSAEAYQRSPICVETSGHCCALDAGITSRPPMRRSTSACVAPVLKGGDSEASRGAVRGGRADVRETDMDDRGDDMAGRPRGGRYGVCCRHTAHVRAVHPSRVNQPQRTH